MIKIVIKNDYIEIKGHSDYEEIGKDIVCASISSIVTTTINAIIRIDSNAITYNSEDGVIIEIKKHSDVIDTLITNMIELFEELEKQYKNNIKIRRC